MRGFLLARLSATPGEPALAGHAGVVAWVEGSRRGGGLRQVIAAELGLEARLAEPETQAEAALLAAEPTPPPASDSILRHGAAADPPSSRRAALSPAGSGPPLSSDILLLIQRQNE